ncbi:MAG: aromatic ring-hydroxylating dioxygenase subunit alpha [Proteobacteria bacterium]|nr:aromatic ring-hydroxylating dioxygenase subunit alpha [Pseudomonadota bacterium]
MTKTTDPVAINDWQVIGRIDDFLKGQPKQTRLLGQSLVAERHKNGDIKVHEISELGETLRSCPVQEKFGHVWTTLGKPKRELFDIPEFQQIDRKYVGCGGVMVKASALRVVENFLDIGHFPYVHTDFLGSEPLTEVKDYKAEIRIDVDEVWADDISFHQDKAMLSATGGVFDSQNTETDLIHFQQMIFFQDIIILENQLPVGVPLYDGAERSIKADKTQLQFRKWLKQKGLQFGTDQET